VVQFKHGDFSTCDVPHPGQPKTVTTPEIIDQIHELILEDDQILVKSIAEQLGISRERVGSIIIHEDLDMRKLSAKWFLKCLNADHKHQRCQLSEQILEFFSVIQMISCCDWWTWTIPGYITMIWRQSNNQWSDGIMALPAPKSSEYKNLLEKFWPRFFGIKMASSSLIIFQRAKLSMWSITHLCWCNWRTFWRQNAMGRSPKGSCSCTTMPQLTRHATQKKLAYLGFQCFDHPAYSLDLAVGLPPVPWTEKTIERSPFFVQRRGHSAAETWLDGQPSEFFLSGLQKLEQRAKKSIELRGEYVE